MESLAYIHAMCTPHEGSVPCWIMVLGITSLPSFLPLVRTRRRLMGYYFLDPASAVSFAHAKRRPGRNGKHSADSAARVRSS